jgi:Sulfatase
MISRTDTMSVMPATRAAFDVIFKNFVVASPNCCPSRSSFLTGRYVHNTGVNGTARRFWLKFRRLEPNSLGPWLQSEGYYTGLIGKYFNYVTSDDAIPPGWDELFVRLWGEPLGDGATGNGTTEFTLRERFGDQNEVVTYPNPEFSSAYATRVFATKAQEFLERVPDDKPFALFVWTIAANTRGPEAAYADAPVRTWNKPPSFMERDMSDKPSEIRNSRQVVRDPEFHLSFRSDQFRQLMTVDDMVETILSDLDSRGSETNRWGVFTSDNGRLWGEHRLKGKIYAYDESAEVPFRMMIPGYPARSFGNLAANIPRLLPTDHEDLPTPVSRRGILGGLIHEYERPALTRSSFRHTQGDSEEAERPSEASLCFVTGDAGIIGPRGVCAPRAPLADAHDLEVARGMGGGRLRLFQASPRPRGEYQALVGHRQHLSPDVCVMHEPLLEL